MKHNFIWCQGLLIVSSLTFRSFDYSISILWKISNSTIANLIYLHAKTCTQILPVRIRLVPLYPLYKLDFSREMEQSVNIHCCSLVAKSCPTLCSLMNCSPPGSFVHGISQARILGWVASSFSRGSSQPSDRTRVSCIAGRFFTIWVTREPPPRTTIYIYIYMHVCVCMCVCVRERERGGEWRDVYIIWVACQ